MGTICVDRYKKKKGRAAALQGETEVTREERASRRRAAKAAKRKRKRQRDAEKNLVNRVNPGLGNKFVSSLAPSELLVLVVDPCVEGSIHLSGHCHFVDSRYSKRELAQEIKNSRNIMQAATQGKREGNMANVTVGYVVCAQQVTTNTSACNVHMVALS